MRILGGASAAALVVVLVAHPAGAAPVALEDAKGVALNLYAERNPADPAEFGVVESFTEQDVEGPLCYIFNLAPNGFVIVSADDAVVPVLGYCSHQHYGSENHPPQFDAWLGNFKEQIAYVKREGLPATTEIHQEWERLANGEPLSGGRTVVGPLLQTHWDQGSPWNNQCPADHAGPGGHVRVGCVAVSMAQAMKHYNWPTQGNGSHGYTHPDYGYIFADFGATTYDWANMPDDTSSAATELLLFHCGVAVEMDYGPYSSGANSLDVEQAVENYFRYDTGCYVAWRDRYPTIVWATMLRDELNNNRPLSYWGGMHHFNLDGYDDTTSSDYYHFNWGWSGSYDGWYYLDNLNPGGHNFTAWQGGIFQIQPIPIILSGELVAGQFELTWTPVQGVAAYWVYGAGNEAYFLPGFGPGYQHRLAVLPPLQQTWSSGAGIGAPDSNWTYLVLAADAADQEMARSNRVGESDFDVSSP